MQTTELAIGFERMGVVDRIWLVFILFVDDDRTADMGVPSEKQYRNFLLERCSRRKVQSAYAAPASG